MLDAQHIGLIAQYALGLGFPTWAIVVLYASQKVTGMIQSLSERLQQTHADMERRMSLIEDAVHRLERMAEIHEERIREIEVGRGRRST